MLQERFVEVETAGPAVGEPQVRMQLFLEDGRKPSTDSISTTLNQ
jgi:hypothetical protein